MFPVPTASELWSARRESGEEEVRRQKANFGEVGVVGEDQVKASAASLSVTGGASGLSPLCTGLQPILPCTVARWCHSSFQTPD